MQLLMILSSSREIKKVKVCKGKSYKGKLHKGTALHAL
jgi:hypothetical protein